MKKNRGVLAVLVVLGFSLGSYAATLESFVPLTEGMVWEYQIKFFDPKAAQQPAEAKAVKKNLAPRELKGIKVVPQVFSFFQPVHSLKQETTSFIVQEAEGSVVVARQGQQDPEPKFSKEKFYIVKGPLQKGASWDQRQGEVLLRTTVADTQAIVTVPAGTFHHCLVLKKVSFKPGNEPKPLHEAWYWFAPGVGHVKVVTKLLDTQREHTQELVSYKK